MASDVAFARAVIAEYANRNPDVVRLARAVSLAVRVEAALLRSARLALTPDLDAGVESDLWFSSLVGSRSSSAIVLDRDVVDILRRDLIAKRTEADFPPISPSEARHVVIVAHAAAPPAIQLEEAIVWLSLTGNAEATEGALRQALKAMHGDEGMQVSRWADRALEALPSEALDTEAAGLLAIGAAARLGQHARVAEVMARTPVPRQAVWMLPNERVSTDALGAHLTPRAVHFVEARTPGSATIEVPKAIPVVEVTWRADDGEHALSVVAAPNATVPLSPDYHGVRVRTVTGVSYLLTPADTARPVAPNAPSASPATGYRVAKVLMLGAIGAGTKDLARAIAGVSDRENDGGFRHVHRWRVATSGGEQGIERDVAIWNPADDPEWPLELDLENVASVLICVDVGEAGNTAQLEAWLAQARRATAPALGSPLAPYIIVVGTRADLYDASRVALAKETLDAWAASRGLHSVIVTSAHADEGLDNLRAEIFKTIDWGQQHGVVSQLMFAELRARRAHSGIVPYSEGDFVGEVALTAVLGVARVLRTKRGIWIADAILFRDFVRELVEKLRDASAIPAISISVARESRVFASAEDSNERFHAVIDELVAARFVERMGDRFLLAPSLYAPQRRRLALGNRLGATLVEWRGPVYPNFLRLLVVLQEQWYRVVGTAWDGVELADVADTAKAVFAIEAKESGGRVTLTLFAEAEAWEDDANALGRIRSDLETVIRDLVPSQAMEPTPAGGRPATPLRVFVGVAAADSGEEFWRFLDDLKRAVQRQVGPFIRFSVSASAEPSPPPLPSREEVQEDLQASRVFVALVTTAYLESAWARKEAADFAVAHRQSRRSQAGRVIAVLWAGGNVVRDNPPEELGDYQWFEPADYGTPIDGFPGALQRNQLEGYERAINALATAVTDALRVEQEPNARQTGQRQYATSAAPPREQPDREATPHAEEALWAVEMAHALAMAFHVGRLGPPEPAARARWYGISTSQEEQDMAHLHFQSEYVFNRPVRDYLYGRHDPFNVDSATNARLLREAVLLARVFTHEALLRLSTMLQNLAENASEDISAELTSILGRSWSDVEKLLTDARLRSGNPEELDELASRIGNPLFLETARPYLGTIGRVFARFPTSLASSENFPTYLDRLTDLWTHFASRATRQPSESTAVEGLTVSRSAFGWFTAQIGKPELRLTGESETGDEIQFSIDRREYVGAVTQLRELYVPALFDEFKRRGGQSPERTPPARPRPSSPPRSAA